MGFIASSNSKDYELAPAGVHPARCYRVIDLGHQQSQYDGQTKVAHKVMYTWELLGEDRMADGRPFSISRRFTVSTHPKSVLRPFLESWRGKAFTPAEEAQFDVSSVAGAYCLLNITHDVGRDGTTYANIATAMPLPKGMPKPQGVNPVVKFSIDEPDMALFDSFGDKLKATIMRAEEWGRTKPPADNGFLDDVPWSDGQPPRDPRPDDSDNAPPF